MSPYDRGMGVRTDCRHYVERTTSLQEKVERCRLDVALLDPFACPEGCLFFERRVIAEQGWTVERRRRPGA